MASKLLPLKRSPRDTLRRKREHPQCDTVLVRSPMPLKSRPAGIICWRWSRSKPASCDFQRCPLPPCGDMRQENDPKKGARNRTPFKYLGRSPLPQEAAPLICTFQANGDMVLTNRQCHEGGGEDKAAPQRNFVFLVGLPLVYTRLYAYPARTRRS